MSSARVKCRVLVDFDGTIATVDTTDLLLERFAEPAWQDIELLWKDGRIGSRECMLRQIDLVRATPAELDAFVAGIDIDPAFPEFAELCLGEGMDVTVVSDGLDRTVGAVLARHGLSLPYYANHLAHAGGDRWRLGFPYARSDCSSLAGNCKCRFAEAPAGTIRIVVGDGRSDFCVAGEADLVLAKGSLARHCEATGLAHFPIQSFAEATPLLRAWLDQAEAGARHGADHLRDD
ncbi:MAG: HAD-IB family phosphatase [Hyphomicrobiaceae bacterium]|nr:HAD-IB family phosphatase [Hyphomicrobiaceae bacterium]